MLIPIARIKDDVIHIKAVREFKRTNYFYINSSGEASVMYRTIDQAKEHIQALFSDFEGFELVERG